MTAELDPAGLDAAAREIFRNHDEITSHDARELAKFAITAYLTTTGGNVNAPANRYTATTQDRTPRRVPQKGTVEGDA